MSHKAGFNILIVIIWACSILIGKHASAPLLPPKKVVVATKPVEKPAPQQSNSDEDAGIKTEIDPKVFAKLESIRQEIRSNPPKETEPPKKSAQSLNDPLAKLSEKIESGRTLVQDQTRKIFDMSERAPFVTDNAPFIDTKRVPSLNFTIDNKKTVESRLDSITKEINAVPRGDTDGITRIFDRGNPKQ